MAVAVAPELRALRARCESHGERPGVGPSKRGGITCALTRGPDGLKVAPDGQVTWPVPPNLEGEDVTAVIALKGASSQERSHTLTIHVR